MAYTVRTDCEIAAGGAARLAELCDQAGNGAGMDAAALTVLAWAQADADSWVNAYMRRLYGPTLPFTGTVPPAIVRLVAAETIYCLKKYRGITTAEDVAHRKERDAEMEGIVQGKVMPVDGDNYPIREPNATPGAFERDADQPVSRETLKGLW